MCAITECKMTPSVQRRWAKLSTDARHMLAHAFRHTISNPHYASEYKSRCVASSFGPMQLHMFRVGYAYFKLAVVADLPVILWGFGLNDGKRIYEVSHFN